MSAPNKSYDPVEVAALAPRGRSTHARRGALAAFAAAADLDALKAARLAHAGDSARSPWPTARSARCRRPPRPTPASGSARPAAGSRPRSPSGRPSSRPSATPAVLVEETVDVTLPSTGRPRGARHPLPTLQERIADIFVGMGWEVAEGPEVEAEWFNFDALNFDADHPARQMQDTFFVEPAGAPGSVLRTHTSPVQIRTLLERGAPIYVICPGQGVPHRRAGRDAHPGLPPDRGSGGRQGPDHGPPQGHPRALVPT